VLTGQRKPMRVPAIIEAAVPISRLGGKTLGQTIYSLLYAASKEADGLVVQTGRGDPAQSEVAAGVTDLAA
jgi:hypothetical protein